MEKAFTRGDALHETLAAMNWRKGRGDIGMIHLPRFEGQASEGAVSLVKQFGSEVRRFTLLPGGKVRFLGMVWRIETHDQRAARLTA